MSSSPHLIAGPIAGPIAEEAAPASDAGFTFVEILVSILLLGTAVLSMVTLVLTSVQASTLARDRANAHAWLQSAADVLYGAPNEDCGISPTVSSPTGTSREPQVRAAYQAVVRSNFIEPPQGWPVGNISIVEPVLFWDGSEEYQPICYDDLGVSLQRITIEVRGLDGRVVESVQVVKG